MQEALFWGCDLLGFFLLPRPVILYTRLGTTGAFYASLLSPFYSPPLSDSTCRRLRALSGGGGSGGSGGGSSCAVASPPLSPVLPKYKLADFRYGREEMLALYVKDNKVGRAVVSGLQVVRDATILETHVIFSHPCSRLSLRSP